MIAHANSTTEKKRDHGSLPDTASAKAIGTMTTTSTSP